MERASATEVPQDWYRSAFPASHTLNRPWATQTEGEIDRVIAILRPPDGARVLDLACGTGRHSIELARRGFSVLGVDIATDLLEVADRDAAEADGDVSFLEADLRELPFEEEFDVVLNLNDGAIGYF